MTVIGIVSALHGGGDDVAGLVAERTTWPLRGDDDLVALAAGRSGVSADRLGRAIRGPRSVFDGITHDWEGHLAVLREAMARLVEDGPLVYHGAGTLLVPRDVSHVMRVCLPARQKTRLERAASAGGLSASAAERAIQTADTALARWSGYLVGLGPWDPGLYDLVIPLDDADIDEVARTICGHATNPVVQVTPRSAEALAEFQLASRVLLALGSKGRDIEVTAAGDAVTITINRYVMRLQHLERQLVTIAKKVPGVGTVETRVGPHFRQPNIYGEMDLEVPRKILLVDDEVEFVQTLSERLETRNLESAVAYDGTEALAIAERDAPDVMVLDMKMPGLDGMEVLRRVKERHPRTEVIVLTAHGSDREKRAALDMGAFAYLRKPADIDDLARLMKDAYAKVQRSADGADGADDAASGGAERGGADGARES